MPDPAPRLWLTAARSDPGRDPSKQCNEDAYRICEFPDGLLVVVCDGMGGHEGGQMASRAAVTTIEQEFALGHLRDDPRERLRHALGRASAEVYALGGSAPASERPGSTCVAAWFSRNELYIAHVGDSRAYRYRMGQTVPLTRDHTMVEAWLLAGQLTPEQAKGHPEAHRITRALGIAPHVEVEVRPSEELRPGDRILLCTDGLTDLVGDSELARSLSGPAGPEALVEEWVKLANDRGGHDNITALLVDIPVASSASPLAFATQGLSPETPMLPKRTSPLESAPVGDELGLPKTVPIETVPTLLARTVVMEARTVDIARGTEPSVPGFVPGNAPGRTVALEMPPPATTAAREKARRTLWVSIAVGLLLAVLALLVPLLRRP